MFACDAVILTSLTLPPGVLMPPSKCADRRATSSPRLHTTRLATPLLPRALTLVLIRTGRNLEPGRWFSTPRPTHNSVRSRSADTRRRLKCYAPEHSWRGGRQMLRDSQTENLLLRLPNRMNHVATQPTPVVYTI
jgi:hypothetical protein